MSITKEGSRSNTNFGQSSYSWKSNWRKDDGELRKTTKKKKDDVVVNKCCRPKTQQRNRDIKCFKCHGKGHISTHFTNKRTMMMRGGEIMTDSEEDEEPMPPLDDTSDVDLEFPMEGEVLVTKCVLSARVKEGDIEQQHENIFHTPFHVNNKVCSLIIDGGNLANVGSAC